MLKKINRVFFGLGLVCCLVVSAAAAGENTAGKRTKRAEQLQIKVVPWGPTQEVFDAAKARVESSAELQTQLKGAKYRLLEFAYVDNETKTGPTLPPTRFRAVYYDYTNDRTLVAESDFAGREAIVVRQEYFNPTPNDEEFNEAVSILQQDKRFADALKSGALRTFQPMPPTTVLDGSNERFVNVGTRSTSSTDNEIVSISLKRGEVIRYPENAPPQSKSLIGSCGPASAGQTTTSQNTAGQYQLTITDGQTTLWDMLVIRPAASSGTRKSGIEVRDVKYKGKSVLKRGHVPVLNVQYTPATCGPYRDWQWQEDMFTTPATGNTDPAPGIRVLADGQVATTELQTGNDSGNFRGVAIYKQDNGYGMEVVLISEMQAGWYRYINEWRFAPDGTIRPRYAFGATNNSCVCDVHNHHAYWRFDFDVVQPNNKVFQVERGRKFLKPITTEISGNKNFQTKRSLLIQNSAGDEAYMLVPNMTDGVADTFGVNDFWVLQYKNVVGGTNIQNEIDDGETCVNCSDTTAPIRITPFINGESVVDQDVVVWYGAHFIHNDQQGLVDPDRYAQVLSGSHVVGPDLRPVRW
ncbi:MAG TPA: hypothetical protein VGC76_06595 [Pyrinomonadaceae bacterium]|jgi:hypothetical protein